MCLTAGPGKSRHLIDHLSCAATQPIHEDKRKPWTPWGIFIVANLSQDPDMQKVTGKTDPVEVMAALREGKNNFK